MFLARYQRESAANAGAPAVLYGGEKYYLSAEILFVGAGATAFYQEDRYCITSLKPYCCISGVLWRPGLALAFRRPL